MIINYQQLNTIYHILKIKSILVNFLALMYASMTKKKEVAKKLIIELIEKGADLNIQDNGGKTALMYAIIIGNKEVENKEVAEELIKAEADLNIQDNGGKTALMYAIKYMPDIAKELIEAGADLDILDANKNTALLHVIFTKNNEVAKKLIDAGADLNKQYVGGLTALMYAIKFDNEEVAEKLIDARAKLDIQDIEGQTALEYAINMPVIAKKLIEKKTLILVVKREKQRKENGVINQKNPGKEKNPKRK